jgi:uncharacterized protein
MKTIFVKLSAFAARIVIVSFALSAAPAFAQEVVGDWAGLLAGQLHIIVHITKSADGHYSGSLESPDQGAFVLPAENVEATPTHLAFSIPKLGGSYDGTWDDTTRSWTGTWKQGQSIPFNLTRLSAQALGRLKPKRPQEDAIAAAPPPYHQHDVTFGNPSARVTLAGTFTVPNGTGPLDVVLHIHDPARDINYLEARGHNCHAAAPWPNARKRIQPRIVRNYTSARVAIDVYKLYLGTRYIQTGRSMT